MSEKYYLWYQFFFIRVQSYTIFVKKLKSMSYVSRVVKGTCPNCGKTKVFGTNGNPLIFKMPKMKRECENCGYSFHRETGFYFGAMYMSYALAVAEMVAVFILGLIFKLTPLQTFVGVVLIILLLSTVNYKLSRLMWLNVFYKKEDDTSTTE